jgi:hypothetical protein
MPLGYKCIPYAHDHWKGLVKMPTTSVEGTDTATVTSANCAICSSWKGRMAPNLEQWIHFQEIILIDIWLNPGIPYLQDDLEVQLKPENKVLHMACYDGQT